MCKIILSIKSHAFDFVLWSLFVKVKQPQVNDSKIFASPVAMQSFINKKKSFVSKDDETRQKWYWSGSPKDKQWHRKSFCIEYCCCRTVPRVHIQYNYQFKYWFSFNLNQASFSVHFHQSKYNRCIRAKRCVGLASLHNRQSLRYKIKKGKMKLMMTMSKSVWPAIKNPNE